MVKILHAAHLKSLKEKLSRYEIDPFILFYPVNLPRGKKLIKVFTIRAKLKF